VRGVFRCRCSHPVRRGRNRDYAKAADADQVQAAVLKETLDKLSIGSMVVEADPRTDLVSLGGAVGER